MTDSLSLSLSLSTCLGPNKHTGSEELLVDLSMYFDFPRKDVHVHVSLSFSLYLHLQKRFGSRSDPNGIQERRFRQFKDLCMR